jgi:hypothetical protein
MYFIKININMMKILLGKILYWAVLLIKGTFVGKRMKQVIDIETKIHKFSL